MEPVPPKTKTHSGCDGFDSYTRAIDSEYLPGGTLSAAQQMVKYINDSRRLNPMPNLVFM